jgi:hypothetical protein
MKHEASLSPQQKFIQFTSVHNIKTRLLNIGLHFNHLLRSGSSPYYLNAPRVAFMRARRAKGASQTYSPAGFFEINE